MLQQQSTLCFFAGSQRTTSSARWLGSLVDFWRLWWWWWWPRDHDDDDDDETLNNWWNSGMQVCQCRYTQWRRYARASAGRRNCLRCCRGLSSSWTPGSSSTLIWWGIPRITSQHAFKILSSAATVPIICSACTTACLATSHLWNWLLCICETDPPRVHKGNTASQMRWG